MTLKPCSLFNVEDTIVYNSPATSSGVNHAPIFIKKELNSLFNYVMVKFKESPLLWLPEESYVVGDMAYLDGKIYAAIADNSNVPPPDPTYWEELNFADDSLDSKYVQLGSEQYIGLEDNAGYKSMIVAGDNVSFIRTGQRGLIPYANELSDLGTPIEKFKDIYCKKVLADDFVGTSTSAKYSDLAERYYADAIYEPGTVLGIGGAAEVTLWTPGMPVAGVVSTAPAFKMNDDIIEDHTMMPLVALKGKIPVKVSTNVTKGDYMLASTTIPGEAYGVITMDKEIIIGGETIIIKDPDMDKRFLGVALEDYTINTTYTTVNIKV